MKKVKEFMFKFATSKGGAALAALALMVTTVCANRACVYMMHQPKLPESAKKLRKF